MKLTNPFEGFIILRLFLTVYDARVYSDQHEYIYGKILMKKKGFDVLHYYVVKSHASLSREQEYALTLKNRQTSINIRENLFTNHEKKTGIYVYQHR